MKTKYDVQRALFVTIWFTREELGMTEEEFLQFDVDMDVKIKKGFFSESLDGTLVSKHTNIRNDCNEYELVFVTDLSYEWYPTEQTLKLEILKELGCHENYEDTHAAEDFFEAVDEVVVDWAVTILGEESFDECRPHGCYYDEDYWNTCEVFFSNLSEEQAETLMAAAESLGGREMKYKKHESARPGSDYSETTIEFSVKDARKVFGPFIEARRA